MPQRKSHHKGSPPTLADIAKIVGVSPSTVSAVLNNMPRVRNYSAETISRIREVAQKMGYMPNPLARTLKKTRSGLIGFVMLSRHSHYYDQLLQGAEAYVREVGYELVTGDMGFDSGHLETCIQRLLAWRVEGLFLMTGGRVIAPKILAMLNGTGIPFVKGGVHHPDDTCVCIDFDNYEAGVLLARHLTGLGHRHVGVLAAGKNNHQANERIRGIKDVLKEAGLKLPALHIVRAVNADVGLAAGYRYTARLLEQKASITAIICMNDLLAVGALRYLHENKVAVPQTLSVTGFDDLCLDSLTNPENRLGAFVSPSLTTIHTPLYDMGRATIKVLVDMIESPDTSRPKQTTTFSPHLIIRESTGPAASP